MGLVRINENFLSLNRQQIEIRLTQLGEKYDNDLSENDLREKLVLLARQRYLKVWHDHSSIAGHTYFLVLVTPIYDESFYYTDREIMESTGKNINIQSIVERPEIHIIGRSGASIANQMLFNKCRQECMGQIDEPVTSESGIAIHDVIRFFHGDGPAQQYEGARTAMFDDFAYCHHAEKRAYRDCQDFVTKGHAWKKRGTVHSLEHIQYKYFFFQTIYRY